MTRFAVLILPLVLAACAPDAAFDLSPNAAALDTSPVPKSCDQRNKGVTAVAGSVVVNEYKGVRSGRNGNHELIEGIFTATWVYDAAIIDSDNVELALNVKSSKDPSGLPHEIPLAVGSTFDVVGEYIPASTANASNKKGAAAVIHFTHTPCGSVTMNGAVYE